MDEQAGLAQGWGQALLISSLPLLAASLSLGSAQAAGPWRAGTPWPLGCKPARAAASPERGAITTAL